MTSTQRTAAVAVIAIVVISVGTAFAVAWHSMPDDQQLQHDAAHELGIPNAVIDAPIVKPIVDDLTQRIRSRAVDDVRNAMLTGAGAGVAIGVAGAALVGGTQRSRSRRSNAVDLD